MPANFPIASRTLVLCGEKRSVEVVIFQPLPSGADYECAFEIRWPDRMQAGHAFGLDAVQALILALRKIGIDLNCSDEAKSGKLGWIEPGNGVGFPVHSSFADLLKGDDLDNF